VRRPQWRRARAHDFFTGEGASVLRESFMTLRSLLVTFASFAFVGAIAGCGNTGARGSGEDLGVADEAIMGGVADAADHAVVDIVWMSASNTVECTGALVAPNMVLTAHHCVAPIQDAPNDVVDCTVASFAAPDVPADFFVSTRESPTTSPGDYHMVREVIVPEGSTSTTYCGLDQAILILAESLSAVEASPLVPRVDGQVLTKQSYTAVGFGATADDGTGAGTRRSLTGLAIDCVGSPCTTVAGAQIDATREWIGDHGTCLGDSGSPALDAEGRVVGVLSRGAAGCTSPIYGDVFAWGAWLRATAVHAAAVGGYAAPAWSTGAPTDPAYADPVGGACGDPATCPSSLCLADAAGSYCTRPCEAAAPCPSGYTCATVEAVQLCQRTAVPSGGGSSCAVHPREPAAPSASLVGAGLVALALRRRRRPG
jgi:MYXO-CTERM domain-containing protein